MRLTTLARHSAIYGVGSVASKIAAILLLPLYTRFLEPADYGSVELILSLVAALGIVTRLGLDNAFFRFFFDDDDPIARRRLFSTVFWTLTVTSTIVAGLVAALAPQVVSLLGVSHTPAATDLIRIGALGLWVMTNYQLLVALYRVQRQPVSFALATVINLAVTVGLTVWFVVGLDLGARGLLLGNFLGSLLVMVGLVMAQRRWLSLQFDYRNMRALLAFGLPLVPAAAALWGVNLVNRPVIVGLLGASALGTFAIAFKLSQSILLLVSAFQLAWPPFAHSIKDDERARVTYANVLSMYTATLSWAVVALACMAPFLVRWLTQPAYYGAVGAVLPLAIGAGLYGAYFIASIGVARVKRNRYNWVVALVAAIVEVALLYLLVPRYGTTGAAWACCAAYGSMFLLMIRHSQRHFHVPWQWVRGARAVVPATGVILTATMLPASGPAGLTGRILLAMAMPVLLLCSGFFTAGERERLQSVVLRRRRRTAS